MGGIQELTHFELLEAQAEHKVPRRPFQRPEAVPAGQGTAHVLIADLRGADVLEDVHCLVAVIPVSPGAAFPGAATATSVASVSPIASIASTATSCAAAAATATWKI